MHEHHIVEGIVKQAVEAAGNKGASRVSAITLAVGELSGLEESSIRLYFENLSRGTIAENAELIIKIMPAKLKCRGCGTVFERKGSDFNCPECNGSSVIPEPGTGKELYIEDISVEA